MTAALRSSTGSLRGALARRISRTIAPVLGLLAILMVGAPSDSRDPIGLYRVALRDRADLERLQRGGFDLSVLALPHGTRGEGEVEVLATRARAASIAAMGLKPTLVEADFSRSRRAALRDAPPSAKSLSNVPPNFGGGAMGGYYTLTEIDALLDHYAVNYPAIVSPKFVIGHSVEGRPIHAIEVSDPLTGQPSDPAVLVDSLHHAREPASMQTLFLFLHRLVTGYGVDPELTGLIETRRIFFVPCVNPDGYVHNQVIAPQGGGLWRKNRRVLGSCVGVDLNRNYPDHFASDDVGSSPNPCAESYRGTGALSEPESQAIDAFVAAQSISLAISLHAHGRQMMYPFGFALSSPTDVAAYEMHGELLATENGYVFGAVSDVVGAANGNYIDHVHSSHHAEAWAFEVGTSFWPTIPEMLEAAERNAPALTRLVGFAGSDLDVVGLSVVDLNGDLDGFPDPGETVELHLAVRNHGRAASGEFGVELESVDPSLAVTAGSMVAPSLASLALVSVGTGKLRATLAGDLLPGARVSLAVELTFGGRSVERSVTFDVGTRRTLARDDAEADFGWFLGLPGDTAFTGRWTRGDPIGLTQGLKIATPEDDATPFIGSRCFVTGIGGTAAGQDDVDDGFTSLVSPVFDLSETVSPRIELARFYWCSKGDQPLRFELSNDGGSTYHLLEDLNGRPNSWRRYEWIVDDHLSPSDRMRLRVTAQDPTNSGVVEAAIDDLVLLDFDGKPRATVVGRLHPGGSGALSIAGARTAPVALFIATLTADVVVPGLTGTLQLDPATLTWLGTVPASPLEPQTVGFTVPPSPALVGMVAYLQPIRLGSPAIAGHRTAIVIEGP